MDGHAPNSAPRTHSRTPPDWLALGENRLSPYEAGLLYDMLGFAVIPIAPNSKQAAVGWRAYQSRKPSRAELAKWFQRSRFRSIAVVTGDVSGGLICRDFDVLESYDRWANEFPDWASRLPTVITRRGRHVYCRADLTVIRAVSAIGSPLIKLGDGELRGGNGYCLLPPSVHPEGAIYAWAIPPAGSVPWVDLPSIGLLSAWCRPAQKKLSLSAGQGVSTAPTPSKKSSAKVGRSRGSRRCYDGKQKGHPRKDDRVAELATHRLTFGKHRGRPLAEVPHLYLRWLIRTVTGARYQAERWLVQQFLVSMKNRRP